MNKHTIKQQQGIARANQALQDLCAELGYNVEEMRSHRRDLGVVAKRERVAKTLRSMGLSYPAIGAAMNRDHTSIVSLVNDDIRETKRKNGRERYHGRL